MRRNALSQTGKILAILIKRAPMTSLGLSQVVGIPRGTVQTKLVYLRKKKFVEKISRNPPYLWKATVSEIPTFLKTKSDGSFDKRPSFSLAYVLGFVLVMRA